MCGLVVDSSPCIQFPLPMEFDNDVYDRTSYLPPQSDNILLDQYACATPTHVIQMPKPCTADVFPEIYDPVAEAVGDLAPVLNRIQEDFPIRQRALDRRGSEIDDLMTEGTMMSNVKHTVKALKSGIDTFMDDIPWFMKALDEVAKVHPYVAAPIAAFKTVYSMARTRRETDKKIIALYVAMKDMISILIQLKDIKDKALVIEGATIEARMQSLCLRAAQDVKECANACDTYSKKKLLAKVLKGPVWEGRLTEFITRFEKCRLHFQLALEIHTAATTENISIAIHAVDEKISMLPELLREMFTELRTQEEHYMAVKIEERGGEAYVQQDDATLRDLIQVENELASTRQKRASWTRPDSSTFNLLNADQSTKVRPDISERTTEISVFMLQELKKDLHEDWNIAVDRNMMVFERKFTILQDKLRDDNNRVIQKLSAGPHDRIIDAEMKEIWRDMGWKRNVEANLFVTTLRQHFAEKAEHASDYNDSVSVMSCVDDWAFEYIGISYFQRIKEAFDGDGSGYVTISSVNRLTNARPRGLNWSLSHWIAYWTIGWQILATKYRDESRALFAQLFMLRKYILPINRAAVDEYLERIWLPAVAIIESLSPAVNVPSHVAVRFADYISREENRIMRNLEVIGYNLDAPETVNMVIGQGRVEKHVIPLICLFLRQHLDLFLIATRRPQSEGFLAVATKSLESVYSTLSNRYQELTALFKHKGRFAEHLLRSYCCELFEYQHDKSPFWKSIHAQIARDDDLVEDLEDNILADSMTTSSTSSTSDRHVQYMAVSPYEAFPDSLNEMDMMADPHVKAILGEWNGFVYSLDEYPIFLMTSFYAHSVSAPDHNIEARGFHYGTEYLLIGTCAASAYGLARLKFSIHYSQEFRTKYFAGYLTRDGSLVGTEGWSEDPSTHQYRFILKRTPADIMCHRPSPLEFRANRPRAWWKFATRATLFQLRKQWWAWSYFAERRETRNKLIEFDIRNYTSYGRPLNTEERLEWTRRRGAITALDARFCREIRDYRLKVIPHHLGTVCIACGYQIRGTRIICLDCQPHDDDYTRTIDVCDHSSCLDTMVRADTQEFMEQAHLPSHDYFKVRMVTHIRDMYAVFRDVKDALQWARRTLRYDNLCELEDDQSHILPGKNEESENLPLVDPDPRFTKRLFSSSTLPPVPQTLVCMVCDVTVHQPCWVCVDCFSDGQNAFLCDECESKTVLKCARCTKCYKQPTWYYGPQFGDKFLCNSCTVANCPSPDSKAPRHTYLHVLVRCKSKQQTPDLVPVVSSAIENATLEREVATLRLQMQEQSTQIHNLEHLLRDVLSRVNLNTATVTCPDPQIIQ